MAGEDLIVFSVHQNPLTADGSGQTTSPANETEEQSTARTSGGTTGGTGNNVFKVWSDALCGKDPERHGDGDAAKDHANKPFVRYFSVEERADMELSLGLFKRPDGTRPPDRFSGQKVDGLKVDVAIGFLNILGAPQDRSWEDICVTVVPYPKSMMRRYNLDVEKKVSPGGETNGSQGGETNQTTYEDVREIQCLLTFDSIFVACFLMLFLDIYPWMLGKVEDIFAREAGDIYHKLSLQILQPENQIPLESIKQVYKLLVGKSLRSSTLDYDEDKVADVVVSRVCARFVESNNLPSFHTPRFLGMNVVRQMEVKIMADTRANSVVKLKSTRCLSAIQCRSLLHCQMEAVWGSAFPPSFLIESDSDIASEAQDDSTDPSEDQLDWNPVASGRPLMQNSYPTGLDLPKPKEPSTPSEEKSQGFLQIICPCMPESEEKTPDAKRTRVQAPAPAPLGAPGHVQRTEEPPAPLGAPGHVQLTEKQYQRELKKLVAMSRRSRQMYERLLLKTPSVEGDHRDIVKPVVEAMTTAVASSEKSESTELSCNPRLHKVVIEAVNKVMKFVFIVVFKVLSALMTKLLSLLPSSGDDPSEADTTETDDAPNPLSSALPTASELIKYGIRVYGQEEGIFPRFETDKWTLWRATLYLPKIHFLGKNTGDRWQSVLAYEDGWKHCTGLWDDIMWYYKQQQPPQKPDRSQSSGNQPGEGSTTGSSKTLPFNPKRRRKPFLSYMQLMDELINTADDVNALITGTCPVILSTNMGDQDAVATFFNDAVEKYANSRVDDADWVQLKTQVRSFHNNTFRRQLVKFLDDNFKPWILVSVATGALLTASTALSTYYQAKTKFNA